MVLHGVMWAYGSIAMIAGSTDLCSVTCSFAVIHLLGGQEQYIPLMTFVFMAETTSNVLDHKKIRGEGRAEKFEF